MAIDKARSDKLFVGVELLVAALVDSSNRGDATRRYPNVCLETWLA